MRIERVYVLCYRGDLHLVRPCVASIRRWYPEIPITLVKDTYPGAFDTGEIEHYWQVETLTPPRNRAGPGFSKLEILGQVGSERSLILDSDIVLLGKVVDQLQAYDEDFLVMGEAIRDQPRRSPYSDADNLRYGVYDLEALRREIDPAFVMPDFYFNTGQMVATTGILTARDFEPFVDYGDRARLKHPHVFKAWEQGLLNYLLVTLSRSGRLSLRETPLASFTINGFRQPRPDELGDGSAYPYVLHWATTKPRCLWHFPYADLLMHFDRLYHARIPHGTALRYRRLWDQWYSTTERWGVGRLRRALDRAGGRGR